MKNLVLVLALFFVACGGGSRPEDTVNGFFDSFRNADFGKMAGFLEDAGGEFDKMASLPSETKELVKTVYKKLEVKVEATKIEGDTAVVEISTSMVDLKSAMSGLESEFKQVMGKLMQQMGNNPDRDALQKSVQKEMLGLFQKAMSAPNLTSKTQKGELNLVKQNGAWKLSKEQNFAKNIFEDLEEILELGN
jgi:hypothetical protein